MEIVASIFVPEFALRAPLAFLSPNNVYIYRVFNMYEIAVIVVNENKNKNILLILKLCIRHQLISDKQKKKKSYFIFSHSLSLTNSLKIVPLAQKFLR